MIKQKLIIKKLKPKNSFGFDLIKQMSDEITNPITLIINQSLTTGIFPSKLKIYKMIPIYKKEDPTLLNNSDRQKNYLHTSI